VFSNEQLEELRNYYQVVSASGVKLPSAKTMADGSSYFLKVPIVNSEGLGITTYIQYTVINGGWYIGRIDEDGYTRFINNKDRNTL